MLGTFVLGHHVLNIIYMLFVLFNLLHKFGGFSIEYCVVVISLGQITTKLIHTLSVMMDSMVLIIILFLVISLSVENYLLNNFLSYVTVYSTTKGLPH